MLFLFGLDGDATAAHLPTAAQNLAAGRSFHARTETVDLGTARFLGLVGPFGSHNIFLAQ